MCRTELSLGQAVKEFRRQLSRVKRLFVIAGGLFEWRQMDFLNFFSFSKAKVVCHKLIMISKCDDLNKRGGG